jgi:hypothetical protein
MCLRLVLAVVVHTVTQATVLVAVVVQASIHSKLFIWMLVHTT